MRNSWGANIASGLDEYGVENSVSSCGTAVRFYPTEARNLLVRVSEAGDDLASVEIEIHGEGVFPAGVCGIDDLGSLVESATLTSAMVSNFAACAEHLYRCTELDRYRHHDGGLGLSARLASFLTVYATIEFGADHALLECVDDEDGEVVFSETLSWEPWEWQDAFSLFLAPFELEALARIAVEKGLADGFEVADNGAWTFTVGARSVTAAPDPETVKAPGWTFRIDGEEGGAGPFLADVYPVLHLARSA